MDSTTLKKVQNTLFDILLEFRRVCNELGVNYFLDGGTLLGAVRHRGFIPWDDDLDVGMLRNDYEIFIEKAPIVLKPDFFLQTWYSDKSYGLAYAKIRMKGTLYIEEASQNAGTEKGFFIDVFPYDKFPDHFGERLRQRIVYDFLKRAIMVKVGYTPWIMNAKGIKLYLKRAFYVGIELYAKMHKRENMIKKYEKSCRRYNSLTTKYMYCQDGATNYGQWIIPSECYQELVDLRFEGELFLVPQLYDDYLRAGYGDYMQLPPEDQRENRHRIVEIKF